MLREGGLVSADRLPPDPFEPAGPGLFAETLAVGEALISGLLDAMDRDGLSGLYDAVLALGRDDLERAALALAVELMRGERLFFEAPRDPADRPPAEPVPERSISEGRRLLSNVIRPILLHG